MIVTIDGPAGSGKSTISKILSEKFSFIYLDTGAMYRAVTYLALHMGIDVTDDQQLSKLASESVITFKRDSNTGSDLIFINDENVTSQIRMPNVDANVSAVSAIEGVRESLVEMQRRIGKNTNLIAEGRDMGTVVFPEADVKIFLTATPEMRAKRRLLQNKERGGSATSLTEEEVLLAIKKRDELDSNRKLAPLKKADDAIEIDTSDKTIDEIVQYISSIIQDMLK